MPLSYHKDVGLEPVRVLWKGKRKVLEAGFPRLKVCTEQIVQCRADRLTAHMHAAQQAT